jgi:hypothetical protein
MPNLPVMIPVSWKILNEEGAVFCNSGDFSESRFLKDHSVAI